MENIALSDLRPNIVGVGNVLMGDDGVGPAAIEALRRRGLGGRAELIDAGLAFSEVLCDLDAREPLVIIDALRGGGDAGSIYKLALDDLDPQSGSMPKAFSLHEVSVLPALRMEALAGREFADVTIFGVEPGEIGWSEQLSAPVGEAVERLPQIICNYLDERYATSAGPSLGGPIAAGGSKNS